MAEFNLMEWLESDIGLEEPVVRRRNLFAKLQRLYVRSPLPVLRVIASAWEFAQSRAPAHKRTRCFCRVVKLRLQEARLWEEEKKYDAMDFHDILASGVFKSKGKLPLFETPKDQPPTLGPRDMDSALERMTKGLPPR